MFNRFAQVLGYDEWRRDLLNVLVWCTSLYGVGLGDRMTDCMGLAACSRNVWSSREHKFIVLVFISICHSKECTRPPPSAVQSYMDWLWCTGAATIKLESLIL